MSAAARPASGFAGMTDRLYRMPIGDFLRRRPEAITCQACGSPLPSGAIFCPSCGVRADDPQAEPLHIVDRTTGLFNERFVRPVLEDELARAHRYQRNLGVLLIEGADVGPAVLRWSASPPDASHLPRPSRRDRLEPQRPAYR